MPDEFTLERSKKLIALYSRYRDTLDASPVGGQWMPYRWWSQPDPSHLVWMPYWGMLADYATDLANIINDLTHHVHRLRAWHELVGAVDDNEKLEASHEFIDMLGTVALGQPYAIKSRFAFAAGHLCHQANRAKEGKDWKDVFPAENLYLNDIEPYGKPWRRFRAFKISVEAIAGSKFKQASDDFRNSYNHGFSARILIGMTGIVRRLQKNGQAAYGIGGSEPLDLAAMADVLATERDHCYRAFEKFQALVSEQVAAIAESDEAERRARS